MGLGLDGGGNTGMGMRILGWDWEGGLRLRLGMGWTWGGRLVGGMLGGGGGGRVLPVPYWQPRSSGLVPPLPEQGRQGGITAQSPPPPYSPNSPPKGRLGSSRATGW